MKTNIQTLTLIGVALFSSASIANARELNIPQTPVAESRTQEIAAVPGRDVDPAEYGLQEADEQVARQALAEQQQKTLPSAAAAQPAVAPAAPASTPTVASSTVQKQDQVKAAPAKAPTDLVHVAGGGRDLPAVPASVAKTSGAPEVAAPPVSSRQDVVVQPGVNTIIPAALYHLNRIVTPFENAIVQTTSQATIKQKGNVIYVSTGSESPVTMYITPKDDESVAISLTLAPRRVPPIEANLIIGQVPGSTSPSSAGGFGYGARYSGQAKKWEEGQPYMETIKGIMRALALGGIPKGYSMAKLQSGEKLPACYQQGLNFDFSRAQVIMGHNFRVLVGVAQNNGRAPIMFDETSCTHPSLAAAAAWPRNMLEAGEKTEVYIVTRVGEAPAEDSSRPSLLN